MTIDLKGFKENYFLDQKKVIDKISKGKVVALKRAAGLIQVIARRLIKKPRRLKISEMGKTQLKRFRARQKAYRENKKNARPPYGPPKRPYKSADPGEPPRSVSGFLKRFLLWGFDVIKEMSVIGPIPSKTNSVDVLEHGGTKVLPNSQGKPVSMSFQGNPFMEPALEKAKPKLPEQFQNIIK